MSKKLERLSDKQVTDLVTHRDIWLKYGLQSGVPLPNNKRLLELFGEVYKAAKLYKPNIIVVLHNPLELLLASYMLTKLDQVWDQVRDQVSDQVSDQVWDQVWDQVRDQVSDQVSGQVWGQVRGQVSDQVSGQVSDQVSGQVWDQVRDQVWGQVRGQVWDQVRDQVRGQLYKACYGTQEAGWLSFYSYFIENSNLDNLKQIAPLIEIAKNPIGWFIPFRGLVLVSPVPKELHRNSRGALHRDLQPALSYEGLDIYALNGVRFTGDMVKFVTTPATDLDPNEILNITNTEQRAEVIKKYGINKLFTKLGPKLLDKFVDDLGNPYELYSVSIGYPTPRIYLKMDNPSVDEIHIEAVHPDCKTCEEALSWRTYGDTETKYITPIALT